MKAVYDLPSALEEHETIWKMIEGHRLVVFLDYDGTLTPIVAHPETAELSSSMRATLQQLASCYTVAIISGRDLKDLVKRVDIDHIFYAGNHGFDIAGPGGLKKELSELQTLLPLLNKMEEKIQCAIKSFEGVQIERKHFSIAIHYRNVKEEQQKYLKQNIEQMSQTFHDLKLTYGKKVLELQPNIDWHKGKAVLWLLDQLSLTADSIFPIYIGDDLTDEDAFKALKNKGLGIVIREDKRESFANFALNNPDEVHRFLQELIKRRVR